MSRVIAAGIKESKDEAFVDQTFEKMLGRSASPVELKESVQFLHQQMSLYQNLNQLTPFTSKEMPEVNHKRSHRIYKQSDLQLQRRKRKKGFGEGPFACGKRFCNHSIEEI